jgi:hypothetical protein
MEVPVGDTTLHLTRRRLLFVLVALAVVGYGGYDYVQQSRAVSEAVTVRATIEDAGVVQEDGGRGGIEYSPSVEYTYRYRGEQYTGDRLVPSVSTPRYDSRSAARAAIEPYDPGTTVTAYVTPGDPDGAFLEKRLTQWYLQLVAVGGVAVVLAMLDSLGTQTPGQEAELRPAGETHSTRSRTLFGLERGTVNRLSKRLLALFGAALLCSLVGLTAGVVVAAGGLSGPPVSIRADPLGPFGLALLAAFGSYLGLVGSVALYGAWSFTEYRHLRERLHQPKPPSPFRHPARLVTILRTDREALSEYGRRVRRTGFAFVIVLVLLGVLGVILS